MRIQKLISIDIFPQQLYSLFTLASSCAQSLWVIFLPLEQLPGVLAGVSSVAAAAVVDSRRWSRGILDQNDLTYAIACTTFSCIFQNSAKKNYNAPRFLLSIFY